MNLRKLNQKGMSLVEVLVMVGIISITVMATLSMQKTNIDVQKQNQLVNTAQGLQTRIRNLFTDNSAFAQTINHNSSMACLKNLTSCTGMGGPITLYDGSGNAIYTSVPDATSGGNGFDERGASCASFSDSSHGNSSCPFGYLITWTPQCVGSCINPTISLIAHMFYRPSASGNYPLNPEKYSIGSIDPASSLKPFIRSATAVTLSFRLVHAATAHSGTCGTGGSYSTRPLSVPASGDPFNLVQSPGPTTRLRNPGTYKCSGTAVGFAVDSFQTQLVVNGGVVGQGIGVAPKWVQGTANIETVFTVTAAGATLQYQQTCTSTPGGSPSADDQALGLQMSPYTTPTVYASLVCALID